MLCKRITIFFAITAFCLIAPTSLIEAATVANSVADFSGTQGHNNWFYGYVAPASSSSFVQLPNFGFRDALEGNAWYIDPVISGVVPPHVFTQLDSVGGAPNGVITTGGDPVEQWVDRRWVSSVTGSIQISGIFGDEDPGGTFGPVADGIIGEILIDGTPVWSLTTSGFLSNATYQTSATVAIGSIIDFVVQPRADDYSDTFTFTAQIDVPEPISTPLPAPVLAGGVLLMTIAISRKAFLTLKTQATHVSPKA